jgi:hypothetical protein
MDIVFTILSVILFSLIRRSLNCLIGHRSRLAVLIVLNEKKSGGFDYFPDMAQEETRGCAISGK